MKKLFRWFKWIRAGKPLVHYEGYHCGLCGRWCDIPFEMPEYKSWDKWHDTWGMCKECELIDFRSI